MQQINNNTAIKNVVGNIQASYDILRKMRNEMIREALDINSQKLKVLKVEGERLEKKYNHSHELVKRIIKQGLICIKHTIKKNDETDTIEKLQLQSQNVRRAWQIITGTWFSKSAAFWRRASDNESRHVSSQTMVQVSRNALNTVDTVESISRPLNNERVCAHDFKTARSSGSDFSRFSLC